MPQISHSHIRELTVDRQARQVAAANHSQTSSEARINAPQPYQSVISTNSASTELSVGDRGPDVQEAQQLLDEAGHSPGPIDGIFGSKTQSAAQAFQQERIDSLNETLRQGPPPAARSILVTQVHNLENELAEGIVGDETLAQLNKVERDADIIAARPTELGVGDRGADVLVAQQALADAGHSPGPIDGVFGQQTLAATQAFQQERIDAIRHVRETAPPLARGTLTERIQGLEEELANGVIGEATLAQFEQLDRDATIRGEKDIELGVGSRGGDVVDLQNDLDAAGFFPGVADGIFGPNTLAATDAFQQSRIDSLEATLAGGPPPAARNVLTEQLRELRDEQARRVAGEQTLAQLEQQLAPPAETEAAEEVDEVESVPETPDDLDVPDTDDVQSTVDSILDGDIDAALENGLNSDGDSVTVSLGATASLPASVVGVEGEVSADITRVEDGYEVSLSAEAAVSMGLAADANDLGAGADIGAGATVIYHYDTLEQAKQGVADLIITAGKNDAVQDAVDLAADSARVANTITDKVGDIIDSFPGPIGSALRAATGGADKLADRIIETLPESLNIDLPWPLGSVDIPLGGLKDDLQELDELRGRAAENLENISNAQRDARARLDGAYSGFEVTGSAGAFADIGILNPIEAENLGLGVSARVEHEVTGRFNADGSAEVSYSYTASGSGNAGLIVGGELNAETSVTISQDLHRNGLSFSTVGDAEVEFRADADALAKIGVGVTYDQGVGGELVYTTTVDELGGQLNSAAGHFLQGDLNGAFGAIGDIEGDVEIQGRTVSGASLSLGGDVGGAELSVSGGITFEDVGETQTIDDLTLEEAFDFLTEQVEDAFDELQSIPA